MINKGTYTINMQPRISSKDAQGMMDAYAKVYAPPQEPQSETENEVETEASAEDDYNEYDADGNLIDLESLE